MNHFITLQQAVDMTGLYRANRTGLLKAEQVSQDLFPLSETFDRHAIDSILEQPDCCQLRIYYGMDPALKVHAVVVGVNSSQEDILPVAGRLDEDAEAPGLIVEKSYRCPDLCPPPSSLNT